MEVSGPSDFVEEKIKNFLAHAPLASKTGSSSSATTEGSGIETRAERQGRPQSPAQFFKLCSPQTDNARTLVAAYFLEKFRSAENFTAGELREVIREAKVPSPRNPSDAVNQNIRKGLLMTAGDKNNKMAFVLTSDGEAAVEDMQHKSKP
ncbi:MAG: hypothetical protein ABI217_08940 [Chthoniobacterales bacterium]